MAIWFVICGLLTYYAATEAPLDPSACLTSPATPGNIDPCDANHFLGLRWHPEKLRFFVLFTLIPPAVLFAIGGAGLWAAERWGRRRPN